MNFYSNIDLIDESNAIEGIHRPATEAEIDTFEFFMSLREIAVEDMERFVSVFEPTAILRTQAGCNVYIGEHTPPSGGMGIFYKLEALLGRANDPCFTPYEVHMEYETLHPFSDGNGRSGRMLWTWMMAQQGNTSYRHIGFLHSFYYQALGEGRCK